MKRILFRLCLVLVSVVWALPSWATSVDLRMSGRELQVGQVAQLQVIVTDQQPNGIPRILFPQSGLNVQFLGQSSQVNSVNGRTTRLYAYNYQIEALGEGLFQVGPATVRMGADSLKTRTVSLRVKPRVRVSAEYLEAYAEWETEEAWVGQVLMYKRGLRSRRPINQDAWSALPSEGVAFLNEGKSSFYEFKVSDPDGDILTKEELHPRVAQRPGVYESAPPVVRVAVVIGRQGNGLFTRLKTQIEVLSVPTTSLTIRPLPPAPSGFSGLVGDFKVKATVEKTEATVGASIPWVVTIEGVGSLEKFDWSIEKDQKGARVYDGTPTVQAATIDGVYVSRARFEQVIVPTEPGTLNLPNTQIIVFSPTKGEYVTHDIAIPPLQIEQGMAQNGTLKTFVGQLTNPEEYVQEPTYEGVREPYATGSAYSISWSWWLFWLGIFLFVPTLFWLIQQGGFSLRRWRTRVVASRIPKEVDPLVLLSRLPKEGDARWSALEFVLTRSIQRAGERLSADKLVDAQTLLSQISAIRYGGRSSDLALEEQVREMVGWLESAKKEAS